MSCGSGVSGGSGEYVGGSVAVVAGGSVGAARWHVGSTAAEHAGEFWAGRTEERGRAAHGPAPSRVAGRVRGMNEWVSSIAKHFTKLVL